MDDIYKMKENISFYSLFKGTFKGCDKKMRQLAMMRRKQAKYRRRVDESIREIINAPPHVV